VKSVLSAGRPPSTRSSVKQTKSLTTPQLGFTVLNVFKTRKPDAKSAETRRSILHSALAEFRERGFDEATMRRIAQRVGMSLGAAYYYFPTKEAIVMAYYEIVQDEHARRVRSEFANLSRLRDRLGLVMHTKLDIVGEDRRLLGALLRFTGEPDHPLSFLGRGTRSLRQESMLLFSEALEPQQLSPELQRLTTLALWGLHMGVMLMFIYDDSRRQQRTRRLVDGALDMAVQLIRLARFPLLKPVPAKLFRLLQEVELIEAS
jgi:AcrR family transcriptional regulator